MDTSSDGQRIQCSKHLANADLPVVCLSNNDQAYVSHMKQEMTHEYMIIKYVMVTCNMETNGN